MKAILLFLFFALQCFSTAKASLITYEFSGLLTFAGYYDCQTYSSVGGCSSSVNSYPSTSDFFNGEAVSLGDHFSGQFTYDTSASYRLSSDGFQAVYLDAITNYQLKINGLILPSSLLSLSGNGSLSIVDDRNGADLFFLNQWFTSADWFATSYINLHDVSGVIYNGFAIPNSVNLNDFSYNRFQIGFLRRSNGDQLQLLGNVTYLVRASVPEPGSLLLFLTSLFILLIRSAGIKKRFVGSRCIEATVNQRTV
ncbi:PEP-CTERM sorting domain-containing protein [Neptunomonas qingdaonensis]|uniref:PEP-CTERM protein-sorting domain-containing protein n=1 Tax=Neptunomonas qingdaonensis TaxID=1045558 RepID=A0A1I2M2R9_9GAMM|nr:PEP-CTERM sorting domain-containing protein [Neptunomonas qingdaonensis]SFF83611.1 PEP-CTERM protein-sorting domain-containing protein [Neptunomonas qingdaonensis]